MWSSLLWGIITYEKYFLSSEISPSALCPTAVTRCVSFLGWSRPWCEAVSWLSPRSKPSGVAGPCFLLSPSSGVQAAALRHLVSELSITETWGTYTGWCLHSEERAYEQRAYEQRPLLTFINLESKTNILIWTLFVCNIRCLMNKTYHWIVLCGIFTIPWYSSSGLNVS